MGREPHASTQQYPFHLRDRACPHCLDTPLIDPLNARSVHGDSPSVVLENLALFKGLLHPLTRNNKTTTKQHQHNKQIGSAKPATNSVLDTQCTQKQKHCKTKGTTRQKQFQAGQGICEANSGCGARRLRPNSTLLCKAKKCVNIITRFLWHIHAAVSAIWCVIYLQLFRVVSHAIKEEITRPKTFICSHHHHITDMLLASS